MKAPLPATVVLFDIDGTLVDCDGAGRQAMQRAFLNLFGRQDALDFSFAGRTDRAIVREGLRNAAREGNDAEVAEVLELYLSLLGQSLSSVPGYRVHAGVEELLLRLRAHRHMALGLGTGNIEPGARLKLGHGRLDHWFSFGAYGSDHEERSELLAIGARRGRQRLGDPQHARVVVIGDTPRNIAAAEAIGAEWVAVTTGPYDASALVGTEGAGIVVESLTESRVWQFIEG